MKRHPAAAAPLLNQDGSVAVDPKRCPTLYRSLKCGMALTREGWGKVVTLRAEHQNDAADRMARKLLGCAEPMSEEAKAKLKAYNEAHKEEITQRRKEKREMRKRLLATTRTKRGRGRKTG